MLASILIAAIVVGVVLYILQLVPMDARIKQIVTIVVIALLAIWAIRLMLGGGNILALP